MVGSVHTRITTANGATASLTTAQRKFLVAFLAGGCSDGTGAAVAAGYSKANAPQQANLLLKQPVIAAAIDAEYALVLAQARVTPARIVAELAAIAFADTRDLYDKKGNLRKLTDLPDGMAHAVAQLDRGPRRTTVRLHDKVRALELLGKFRAMFTDKVQIDGNLPVLRIVEQTGRDLEATAKPADALADRAGALADARDALHAAERESAGGRGGARESPSQPEEGPPSFADES